MTFNERCQHLHSPQRDNTGIDITGDILTLMFWGVVRLRIPSM